MLRLRGWEVPQDKPLAIDRSSRAAKAGAVAAVAETAIGVVAVAVAVAAADSATTGIGTTAAEECRAGATARRGPEREEGKAPRLGIPAVEGAMAPHRRLPARPALQRPDLA
jgi:hypothetical protein